MDFIIKLLPLRELLTKELYNSILVIIDKYTKYIIVIPFNETYTAVQLGYIFLDRVVRIYGFPKEIISDKDKLFISSYWKTIIAQSGVKQKLSIVYYLKTDRQTERMNRILKGYLKYYINRNQTNWVELLPVAELAMDNLISRATGITPFFANYRRYPNIINETILNLKAQQGLKYVQDLTTIHS